MNREDAIDRVLKTMRNQAGASRHVAAALRSRGNAFDAARAEDFDESARLWQQLFDAVGDGLFVQLDAEDAAGDLERRAADDRPAREILAELTSARFAVAPGGIR